MRGLDWIQLDKNLPCLQNNLLQLARIIPYNSISQVEVKAEAEVDWRREWVSALYLSVRVILMFLLFFFLNLVGGGDSYWVAYFQSTSLSSPARWNCTRSILSMIFRWGLIQKPCHSKTVMTDCVWNSPQDLLSDLGGYLGLLLGWYISVNNIYNIYVPLLMMTFYTLTMIWPSFT